MIANPNSTTWTLRRPNQLAAYAATTVVVPTRHPSPIAPHGGAVRHPPPRMEERPVAPRSAWRGVRRTSPRAAYPTSVAPRPAWRGGARWQLH